MKDKKVVIAIILCIGALISLIYGITAGPRTKRKVSPGLEAASTDETICSSKYIVPAERRSATTDFATWGRNPFVPKAAPEIKGSDIILDGIMWDKENPKAIINNAIVGIGDEIKGNRIIEIEKESVTLNDGTEDFTLSLK